MKYTARKLWVALAALLSAAPVIAQVAHDGVGGHHGDRQYPIEVLSSRPDAISGGDALIRVTVKKSVALRDMRIHLNRADVTSSFIIDGAARTLTGLVSGMRVGENLVEVIDPRGNVRGKGRAEADMGGWYSQGASTGGVTDNFMLSNGYALASSSLNVFGNNCNDLTAAESMAMVKERFIEAYGLPAHTQGFGCSGGSYQQHQITDNYPGLLDGIIPGCSFPEVGFAAINFITDAWLLDTYFNSKAAVPWSAEQMRRVTGFLLYETAPNVAGGAHRIDPKPGTTSCDAVPVERRYDAVSNPRGVRCTVYDHTVNVYGRDPATGFALRPLDNVGIQYGLGTLNASVISVDQFLDLNEKIGGFDRDATIVPQRTVADLSAARAAYQTGRLTSGRGGLASVPIIDFRDYNDALPGGDIHVRYHSFSMRKRLDKANGRHDNQLMVVNDNRFGLYSTANPLLREAILKMDRWITAVKADTRDIREIDKVVENKPADVQEGCYSRDPTPVFIAQAQVREQEATTTCGMLYPTNSFPREVAGADIASDIIKCQLKPLTSSDYAVAFTPAQWARLQAIFPSGVCDWSKPGIEQQDLLGTWVFFE